MSDRFPHLRCPKSRDVAIRRPQRGGAASKPAALHRTGPEVPGGLLLFFLVAAGLSVFVFSFRGQAAEITYRPARRTGRCAPRAEATSARRIHSCPRSAASAAAGPNARVRRSLRFFREYRRREIVQLWLDRSGRYLGMIEAVLRRFHLPGDLAYMAMVESGFDPTALSPVGARGLWQLMPDTARRYGLRVDSWVDERLDPEKSTVAAARYLRDLFRRLHSWLLVKAAYNAGGALVTQAVRRSHTRDFWSLSRQGRLPQETESFVPDVQAAVLIGKDPRRYGFKVTRWPPLRCDHVLAPPGVRLARLAARLGVSLKDLEVLNRELRRRMTPPDRPYVLKVPRGEGGQARTLLAEERR